MTERRVRIPADLIEGPAKIYFSMKVGEYYSIAEIEEMTKIAKSTCARYLASLTNAGVLLLYRGHNTRGRPAHYYRIATNGENSTT